MPVPASPDQPRKTVAVKVGGVTVGGAAPVVVQSMTNTDTVESISAVCQVMELAQAGSELVRLTVNNEAAARAIPEIAERLDQANSPVPLVGDFHFNGHKLLAQVPECATSLAKFRINPGNVGRGRKRDEQFAAMIETACRHDKPVRIGVNWGSLDRALVARISFDYHIPPGVQTVETTWALSIRLPSRASRSRLGVRTSVGSAP